ncbi:MAG TPA: LegC family aminotransferase [Bacillota bacterium]|nr:LegC family aminotransferase [Bacillota bacterium]
MIPLSVPHFSGNEWTYVKECIDTNWVSSAGRFVDLFEERMADYLGIEYGVAVVNGTAAIHLALKLTGVEPGDRVLVPSLTFIASVNPIKYCGAEPVFVEVNRETWGMDPAAAAAKVEELEAKGQKVKAMIVVHLFGHPVDLDPLVELCRRHNIWLIEDATEALGSEYRGKKAGTIGDIGCFSFNGNKLITTGGGGMLVTREQSLAEKARYLSQQAKDDPENFIHREIGYNYRLTNIQAALGVAQLEQINGFLKKKKAIAAWYSQELASLDGITLTPEQPWANNSFWLYSILVDPLKFGMGSRELIQYLRRNGVQSRPFFYPVHRLPMYEACDRTEMKETMLLWEEGVNLPSSVSLTEEDLHRVVEVIRQAHLESIGAVR